MPIHTQIDLTRQLTIYTVTETVTFDEIMIILKEFYSTKPTLKVLCDLSKGSLASISYKQIEKLIEYVCDMERKTRIIEKLAAVSHKAINYGLLRMAQISLDMKDFKPEHRIFRKFDDAVAWLDE